MSSNQIQATVPAVLAEQIERVAQSRDRSTSAFVRDVLAAAIDTTGTFYGTRMLRATDEEWINVAMPYANVVVIDGALVFQNAAGLTQSIIAPGRWVESNRRIEADRALFI